MIANYVFEIARLEGMRASLKGREVMTSQGSDSLSLQSTDWP